MSEKVKLTKAQSEEIKTLLKENPAEDIIQDHVEGKWWDDSPLNGLALDTLIRALYIGYEVEQTPEEKLLYCYAETSSINEDFREGYRAGIEGTLKILNIKIKGIND